MGVRSLVAYAPPLMDDGSGNSTGPVLVTGGAGYVGSHAVRCLRKNGIETVIVDDLSTGFDSLVQGPIEDLTVDIAALSELLVEGFETSILLAASNVNRLAALELDTHGGRADWGLAGVILVEHGVMILRHTDVGDSAGA